MKGKMLRIALAVAVLGALAAIPASTQVPQTSSATVSDRAGGNLPLVLLVNRLELTRAQMETLRTTVRGLLVQRDGLDQKRAAFEQEMIAFNGAAEQLDARIAAFHADMATAREAFREQAAAAVDTLKETLTMKQGEILMNALPGLMGRLDAVSSRAESAVPQAMSGGALSVAASKMGTGTQRGRIVVSGSDGRMSATTVPGTDSATATAQTVAGASSVVDKIQAMAERVRDRISARRGEGAATITTPAVPACPMMSPTAGADFSQGAVATVATTSPDDFGTLTISLSDDLTAPLDGATGAGRRFIDGLERLVEVLELKLAAMS